MFFVSRFMWPYFIFHVPHFNDFGVFFFFSLEMLSLFYMLLNICCLILTRIFLDQLSISQILLSQKSIRERSPYSKVTKMKARALAHQTLFFQKISIFFSRPATLLASCIMKSCAYSRPIVEWKEKMLCYKAVANSLFFRDWYSSILQ